MIFHSLHIVFEYSGSNSTILTLLKCNAIKIMVIIFIYLCTSFEFSHAGPQATCDHKHLSNVDILGNV